MLQLFVIGLFMRLTISKTIPPSVLLFTAHVCFLSIQSADAAG